MNDPFWVDDYSILYKKERLIEFFISNDQTVNEKLNSIVRFGIYTGIVLTLYKNEPKYLFIGGLAFFITFLLNKGMKGNIGDSKIDNFSDEEILDEGGEYTEPTINNPFGNNSVVDIIDNPKRPPMKDYVSYNDEAIRTKEEVEKAFNYNLYKDLGDIYNKKHSQREFYTVPSKGSIPPDPNGDFKKWLYGDMKSFKDNYYDGARRIHEPLQFKK